MLHTRCFVGNDLACFAALIVLETAIEKAPTRKGRFHDTLLLFWGCFCCMRDICLKVQGKVPCFTLSLEGYKVRGTR